MTKEEALTSIDKPSYSAAEVKHLITGVSARARHPNRLKRGDIYLTNGSGSKRRPVVIVKVTKDALNLCPSQSRFTENGYFTRMLVSASTEYAIENFAGVYRAYKRLTGFDFCDSHKCVYGIYSEFFIERKDENVTQINQLNPSTNKQ